MKKFVICIKIIVCVSSFYIGWIFFDIVKDNVREEIRQEIREEMRKFDKEIVPVMNCGNNWWNCKTTIMAL